VVFIVGFGSLTLALSPQPLLAWFVWAALSLMVNCFFFPIVLGIYWKRMNRHGARMSMITGFAVTTLTFAIFGKSITIVGIPVYSVLPGFLASLIISVFVSLLAGEKSEVA
jgi:Na+/proline symporter